MTKVIVSLTTYGSNARKLAPTAIKSILGQSHKADKVVLWIGKGTYPNIKLLLLVLRGLTIRYCEDVGPSTKIIPSLAHYPNDTIITADDDIIYPKEWLERLLKAHIEFPRKIITHRAHGITRKKDGKIAPYSQWKKCIDFKTEIESKKHWNIFPTGVGGVLYPPGSLPIRTLDTDELKRLTPKNDDIWLWAMAHLNEGYFKGNVPYVVLKNGYSENLAFVDPEREANSLGTLGGSNVLLGGNDKQIQQVIDAIPELNSVVDKM